MTRFDSAVSPSGIAVDRLNTIFNPLKFKARASVTWDFGRLRSQVTATHVGGYSNTAVTPNQKIKSYTPVDLSFAVNVGEDEKKGLIIGLEVRNLFDTDPPYVNLAPGVNGSGGYDATTTNPIGRTFTVSARKTF
jgi:iron complex outermembrane receptor protein